MPDALCLTPIRTDSGLASPLRPTSAFVKTSADRQGRLRATAGRWTAKKTNQNL